MLDPALASNGGPTRTHALVPGSPAIDARTGRECAGPLDQRGYTRPVGARCDIGPVEWGATGPPPSCAGFLDVPPDHPACPAIAVLVTRGILRATGTPWPQFLPDDPSYRLGVVDLLLAALDWEYEPDGPRAFADTDSSFRGPLDPAGILANKCDAAGRCVAQGFAPTNCYGGLPCFYPFLEVTRAQAISLIARALVVSADYAWEPSPAATNPYTGVPAVHASDVATYVQNAGPIPDAPATSGGWNAPASRAWVAMALAQALQTAP